MFKPYLPLPQLKTCWGKPNPPLQHSLEGRGINLRRRG